MAKYEFTGKKKKIEGHIVQQIRAVDSFGAVSEGDIGGWIEHKENLSQRGTCWVAEDACVYGLARVGDNAIVRGHAQVEDSAIVCDEAVVQDNAKIRQYAEVYGFARVLDKAVITGNAKVHDNARISGNACVSSDAEVCDSAQVKDNVWVYGTACVDGDKVLDGNQEYNYRTLFRGMVDWFPDFSYFMSPGNTPFVTVSRA